MHTGAFDAVEEEFFREGDRLSTTKREQTEDFSDLDAPRRRPRPQPAPNRRRLARGTPRPEPRPRVSAPARARRYHLPAAVAAGVLAIGLLARIASPTEDSTLAASRSATAAVPPTVAVAAPEAVTVTAPAPVPVAAIATPPEPAPVPIAEPAPAPERLTPAQRRKRAEAAYAKGRTAYMQGDFRGSIRHFQRAVSADASFAKGHRAIGLAYRELGDRPRSDRALRAYLKTAPRAPDAKVIRRMLEGRR